MSRRGYSAQYKTKLVLEVLQGEKELETIAYENNINPNMLRNWKREFLDNASCLGSAGRRTITSPGCRINISWSVKK